MPAPPNLDPLTRRKLEEVPTLENARAVDVVAGTLLRLMAHMTRTDAALDRFGKRLAELEEGKPAERVRSPGAYARR